MDHAMVYRSEAPSGKALALKPSQLPLLGSSKIERIRAAVSGLSLTLNREQWYRIWEASNGAAVP